MNAQEWAKMRATEEKLWWYKALHRFLLKLLDARQLSAGTLTLDVGCGTGGFMQKLSTRGYPVIGFDISSVGAHFTHGRGDASTVVASANTFPFDDASFDLVTCIDVLESESVNPLAAVQEASRVLKAGGYGLFQMAAHQWLLSEHDRAVHSVRRYNKSQFASLFKGTDFKIIYITYLFFLLFPLTTLWKIMRPPKMDEPIETAVSDVDLPNNFVNVALYAICQFEAALIPTITLPTGTSICALVQKHG